jgi:hypothetical protein
VKQESISGYKYVCRLFTHRSLSNKTTKELLKSEEQHDAETTRDLIASVVTSNKGEYLLRLGSFPPRNLIFNDEVDPATASDGWIGTACTSATICTYQKKIKVLADEVGVKVSEVFTSGKEDNCRAALLLRIPPTSVSNTPEVRCAVVGNVDSGKSTTLGVLTRGGLDDGRGRARVGLFRHKHEIETGRTSSVGMEVRVFSSLCPTVHDRSERSWALMHLGSRSCPIHPF